MRAKRMSEEVQAVNDGVLLRLRFKAREKRAVKFYGKIINTPTQTNKQANTHNIIERQEKLRNFSISLVTERRAKCTLTLHKKQDF